MNLCDVFIYSLLFLLGELQRLLDCPGCEACEEGYYEVEPCSSDPAAQCSPCITCGDGEYQARPCTQTSNT